MAGIFMFIFCVLTLMLELFLIEAELLSCFMLYQRDEDQFNTSINHSYLLWFRNRPKI